MLASLQMKASLMVTSWADCRTKKIDAISTEEKILLMFEAIAVLEEGDADEREDKT